MAEDTSSTSNSNRHIVDINNTKMYPNLSGFGEGDHNPQTHTKQETRQRILEWLGALHHYYMIMCVLILIVGVMMNSIYSSQSHIPKLISSYNREFEEIKKEFPSQSKLSWMIINMTLFNHIYSDEDPLKPAVINLIGDMDKVNKLVYSLSTVLMRAGVSSQCKSLTDLDQSMSTDDMKMYIEQFILSAKQKRAICVYIPHLDRITPLLGPYLHGLTDEITARFKDVIYIFSVSPSRTLTRDDEAEKVLMDTLSDAWLQEMGPERFDALMIRVAVNVVMVV